MSCETFVFFEQLQSFFWSVLQFNRHENKTWKRRNAGCVALNSVFLSINHHRHYVGLVHTQIKMLLHVYLLLRLFRSQLYDCKMLCAHFILVYVTLVFTEMHILQYVQVHVWMYSIHCILYICKLYACAQFIQLIEDQYCI